MKHFLIALFALSVVLASCTKEVTPNLSVEDMLRKGKWRVAATTVTLTAPSGKQTTINYDSIRKTCMKDNYLHFDSLTKGAVINGSAKCSIADADSIGFVWTLSANDTKISLNNYYMMIDYFSQYIVYNATDNVWIWKIDSAITDQSNLINASITDFSQNSFMLNYSLPGTYLDTTGGNQASPTIKPDTYNFHIKFNNF